MNHNHKTVRKMTAANEAGSDIAKSRAVIFPRLKPSRRSVTVRVPTPVLDKIMAVANRRGSRYQSMINEWLSERADTEFNRAA
jgi:predicted DNA binding CopG/RHH family protein